LLPYFEWESTQNFFGNQYDVAEGFHLECRDIDNKEDYYVIIIAQCLILATSNVIVIIN